MSNFFKAIKRAADRLDKTAGFDAPYGTRPYRSVGDAVGEAKSILDALDEDAGLTSKGSYEHRIVKQANDDARWKYSAVENATREAAEVYKKSLERSLGREQ